MGCLNIFIQIQKEFLRGESVTATNFLASLSLFFLVGFHRVSRETRK